MEKIAHLKSRSLLNLTGSDTTDFLQNLITCDVTGLSPGKASFGALLTPQGKVLFDFFVLRNEDGFTIDVDAEQRPALAKRLTFYKLRADVQIEDDDRSVMAIWPTSDDAGFADPRHSALGNRAYGVSLDANASEQDWHDHRIGLGVPHSGVDFDLGEVFPHDVLMDQFSGGGVDFTKGCYVGQEVVSRMQHRGTARNRFVQVAGQAGLDQVPAGTSLIANEKRIGTMGSVSGSSGLALVRVDRAASAQAQQAAITVMDAPVTLSPAEFTSFDWSP